MKELLQRIKVKYVYPSLTSVIKKVDLSINASNNTIDKSPAFFLLGTGRNGSTLLSCMLNNHADVFVPSEHYAFPKTLALWNISSLLGWERYVDSVIENFKTKNIAWQIDWNKASVELKKITEGNRNINYLIHYLYSEEAACHEMEFKLWGDKTPLNTDCLPLITPVFPHAKFVFLVRDPRAVINSYIHFPKHLKRLDFWIWKWKKRQRIYQEYAAQLPDQFHLLRYEDLIIDPESTLQSLCVFLNIEYDDNMTEDYSKHMKIFGVVDSHNHTHLDKAMSPHHIDKWKDRLSKESIASIESQLSKEMKQLSYL